MIKININKLRNEIQSNVTIIAVSKSQPVSSIIAAYETGITNFGENYLQEALLKAQQLTHLPLTWHFIGRLQSNKLKAIAENFDWVHTVTTLEQAEKLNKYSNLKKNLLNICLQINVDNDPAKGGIAPEDAVILAKQCISLNNIKLQGLMTILNANCDEQAKIQAYKQLAVLENKINQALNLQLNILSMGMSDDYKAAIAAGSNMIRIGTAIFGRR